MEKIDGLSAKILLCSLCDKNSASTFEVFDKILTEIRSQLKLFTTSMSGWEAKLENIMISKSGKVL